MKRNYKEAKFHGGLRHVVASMLQEDIRVHVRVHRSTIIKDKWFDTIYFDLSKYGMYGCYTITWKGVGEFSIIELCRGNGFCNTAFIKSFSIAPYGKEIIEAIEKKLISSLKGFVNVNTFSNSGYMVKSKNIIELIDGVEEEFEFNTFIRGVF